jgi:hypothetical protein
MRFRKCAEGNFEFQSLKVAEFVKIVVLQSFLYVMAIQAGFVGVAGAGRHLY